MPEEAKSISRSSRRKGGKCRLRGGKGEPGSPAGAEGRTGPQERGPREAAAGTAPGRVFSPSAPWEPPEVRSTEQPASWPSCPGHGHEEGMKAGAGAREPGLGLQ